MNFNNSFVLFLHFLCLDKQNVKKVFYDLQSAFREFMYISKWKILKTIPKTCEKVLKFNTNLVKMKVENFIHS